MSKQYTVPLNPSILSDIESQINTLSLDISSIITQYQKTLDQMQDQTSTALQSQSSSSNECIATIERNIEIQTELVMSVDDVLSGGTESCVRLKGEANALLKMIDALEIKYK